MSADNFLPCHIIIAHVDGAVCSDRGSPEKYSLFYSKLPFKRTVRIERIKRSFAVAEIHSTVGTDCRGSATETDRKPPLELSICTDSIQDSLGSGVIAFDETRQVDANVDSSILTDRGIGVFGATISKDASRIKRPPKCTVGIYCKQSSTLSSSIDRTISSDNESIHGGPAGGQLPFKRSVWVYRIKMPDGSS